MNLKITQLTSHEGNHYTWLTVKDDYLTADVTFVKSAIRCCPSFPSFFLGEDWKRFPLMDMRVEGMDFDDGR